MGRGDPGQLYNTGLGVHFDLDRRGPVFPVGTGLGALAGLRVGGYQVFIEEGAASQDGAAFLEVEGLPAHSYLRRLT
ncbi:MAG: hypothetical protein Q8R28_00075 [Dehalococcoidia bacterium]|nr:hypothetical protein [Dehalococcoidia bacterium]